MENKTLDNDIRDKAVAAEDKRAKYPFGEEHFETLRSLIDRNDIESATNLISERLKRHRQNNGEKEQEERRPVVNEELATENETNTYFVSYYYAKESDLPETDKVADFTRAVFPKINLKKPETVGLESLVFPTADMIDSQEKLLTLTEEIREKNGYKSVVIIGLSLLAAG